MILKDVDCSTDVAAFENIVRVTNSYCENLKNKRETERNDAVVIRKTILKIVWLLRFLRLGQSRKNGSG